MMLAYGYILHRPDLAARVGAVAASWAYIEERVAGLYAALMGAHLPADASGHPLHPVAYQVFDSLESQRLRSNLLRRLAASVVGDPNLLAEIEKLIHSLDRAARIRNRLIHSNWAVSDDYPDAIIQVPVQGERMVYTRHDFDQALEQLEHVLANVNHTMYRVADYFYGNPKRPLLPGIYGAVLRDFRGPVE